jgi:hypothetical protein
MIVQRASVEGIYVQLGLDRNAFFTFLSDNACDDKSKNTFKGKFIDVLVHIPWIPTRHF